MHFCCTRYYNLVQRLAADWTTGFPGWGRDFPLLQSDRLWVPKALSKDQSGRSVNLTTRLNLVPEVKNAWSYTSTPQ